PTPAAAGLRAMSSSANTGMTTLAYGAGCCSRFYGTRLQRMGSCSATSRRAATRMLNTKPGFAGKVEIFGTWAVFADIFNGKRSGLPIRAGGSLIDASDNSPQGELLNELYRTTTRLEGSHPF